VLPKDPTTCSDLEYNLTELLEAYKASHLVKPERLVTETFAVERPWMKGKIPSRALRSPASPGILTKEDSTCSSQKDFWNDS